MQKFKSVLMAMAWGIVCGSAVADLVGSKFLGWYNIPGYGQAQCNCSDIVHGTLESIIRVHWIGGAVGGIVFAIGALAMKSASASGKTAARGPTPPA